MIKIIYIILLFILSSCKINYKEDNIIEVVNTESYIVTDSIKEYLIYSDSLQEVWLSSIQYKSILSTQADTIIPPEGFSIITKNDAKKYHMIDIPINTGERYLCLDSSGWYTFKWNEGIVSKAGTGNKAKYTLSFIKEITKDTITSVIYGDYTYYIEELN